MDFDTQDHKCRPESEQHLVLRMTGQKRLLSRNGKRFKYQFQRYGYQRMAHDRKQNIPIEHLKAELVAHKVRWDPSKAGFILDG